MLSVSATATSSPCPVRSRITSAAQTPIAAYALFGMMNWIHTWYHPAGPTPPAALADELASLFLDGYIAAHHTTPRLVATLGG